MATDFKFLHSVLECRPACNEIHYILVLFKDSIKKCFERNKRDDSHLFLTSVELLIEAWGEYTKVEGSITSPYIRSSVTKGLAGKLDELKSLEKSLKVRGMI